MPKLYLTVAFLLILLSGFQPLHSQHKITGVVVDVQGKAAIEYAAVALLSARDSTTVDGTVTDAAGNFELEAEAGTYLIKTTFIGYESQWSEVFALDAAHPEVKLPIIGLIADSQMLEEVEVVGEKGMMQMSFDKKVFNVGKDLANAGANASEILSNIPSVTVGPEGDVKLRGNSNVRILIDGKPSGIVNIKGGAGLRQLQGSLIESVEVITNPSARYEAEGNAGIINIVLKKERKEGFNGSFELIGGSPANFGVSANVNYRTGRVNFFINYGVNYRIEPNVRSLYQEVYGKDTIFIQKQSGEGDKKGLNNNIRGGLDYFFNELNILTASYRFQRSDARRITDLRYEDYLFNADNLVSTSLRNQDEKEKEPYSEYVLSYKKRFAKEGQEFNADVRYLSYWENSDQKFREITFLPGQSEAEGTVSRQNSVNDEYENQYLVQMDYVQPIGKDGKLEAGLRSSFRDMTNDFLATELNDQGEWVTIPEFDNIFVYTENIHGLYGILGNKGKKWSYQMGLRAEITDVKTALEETNEENPRDYTNLFPSAHVSYHLPGDNDIQLSYSRRVRRPVYTELSPFVTLADGRNFFSGNPDLDPEFTHAFEIGHLKYFEKGSLSSSLYYRSSEGTIQGIIRVDERGFSTRLPENLNGQEAYGAEMAFSYALYPWWKLDASFNFFRAITDGANIDATFSSDTYSWFVRQTSRFSLPRQIDLQVRANYDAPERIPQGKRKSYYFFDLSVKKDLWNKKGSLTLTVMDVLNSRKNRSIIEGETFYSDRVSQFQRRQVNLTLGYRLNQ